MAENTNPRGRKNVTGTGTGMHKRGEGLGTGPVGSGGSGRPQGSYGSHSGGYSGGSGDEPSRGILSSLLGGNSKILIIVIVLVLVLGGGGGLSGVLGNVCGGSSQPAPSSQPSIVNTLTGGGSLLGGLGNLLGGQTAFSGSSVSTGWNRKANTGVLNTNVASEARTRYYKPAKNDTVTLLVYMCGADLESKYGMASNDLLEMCKADLPEGVDLIVYTGGCKNWQSKAKGLNVQISNTKNQIYKIENHKLVLLETKDRKAMTDSATLQDFLTYGKNNYKADRNILIFWDHGGGSISGYGYDENYTSKGSMTLAGINTALKGAKMQKYFDFIGFDTCLMATAENALMLTAYADYMIASEETEPGVGWYYTNWLSLFKTKGTNVSTLEIGQKIIDDFVDVCSQQCSGQKTTLSMVDLAELQNTVPDSLKEFATSTAELVQSNSYQTVADARSGSREFASSNRIDQVDLIDLAYNINSKESKELAEVLLSAVKYNRTSSNMTNAYGLSIYFPYQTTSKVNSAVNTFDAIGMDDEYLSCIKTFASMEVGGQAVSAGSGSPAPSLLGTLGSITGTGGSSDLISGILGNLLGGNLGGISSITDLAFGGKSLAFMDEASLDRAQATEYLSQHYFDASRLLWTKNGDQYEISLPLDQWKLVQDLELNVFFDDGEGYVDLGFDNQYAFTDEGALIGDFDGTWLAINNQVVPFYYTDMTLGISDEGDAFCSVTGYVPVVINGTWNGSELIDGYFAQLLIVLETGKDGVEYGRVAGILPVDPKHGKEAEAAAESAESAGTVAKAEPFDLSTVRTIEFVCDYYSYDGEYQDSYLWGDVLEVRSGTELKVSYVYLPDTDKISAMYRIKDIYNSYYWTPEFP